jgi:hypothetical protein
MGCSWNRQDTSLEEMCLENEEKVLGYSNNNVANIDMILRKHSYLGKLNKKQMSQAAAKLNLNVSNSRGHMKVYDFYNSFKLPDEYDLNLLLVAGILLGQGTSDLKAKLLWEIYDVDGTEEIGKDMLYTILQDMCNIALDRIAFLVSDSPICSEYKVKSYVSNCNAVRSRTIDKVLFQLLGRMNSIKKARFIARMSKIADGDMLRSKGIRKIMHEEYSKAPYADTPKHVHSNSINLFNIIQASNAVPEEEEFSDAE